MLFSGSKTDNVKNLHLIITREKFNLIKIIATVTDEKDKNSTWFVMAKG